MSDSQRELPPLDPILLRQLKRAGVAEVAQPDSESFAKLLAMISDHYRRAAEDRAMLTRSMDLSSAEFDVLRERVERQRDSFRDTISALNEALSVFGEVVHHRDGSEDTGTTSIEAAKADFSSRLYRIFDAERDASASAEISGLSVNLVKLADQLTRLLESSAAQASVRKELEVARAAQRMLMPGDAPMERGAVRIAGVFRPASECGGDFWSVQDLPNDTTLVLVGDVTGHGVSAAILTGVAKGACEAYCATRRGSVDPAELLGVLNGVVRDAAQGNLLMTFAAAIVNPRAKTVLVANAGHPHVLCIRPGEAKPLVVDGPPLGSADEIVYRSQAFGCDRGDSLVWFTDGVVERENPQGEAFGERRLRAVCQRAAQGGVDSILALVESTLEGFAAGIPASDDTTLVVATIK